ncbi:MAG: type II toxin-antitoxin system VapC family toxin [Chloroflexota bacterium]
MNRQNLILDAWALLALLQREEPAASKVKSLVQEAQEKRNLDLFVSVINLGEVYYRVGRKAGALVAQETLEELRNLGFTILSATDRRVFQAADLKRQYAISYADAFAVAAAAEQEGILVTGDPELIQLEGIIQVDALSRKTDDPG